MSKKKSSTKIASLTASLQIERAKRQAADAVIEAHDAELRVKQAAAVTTPVTPSAPADSPAMAAYRAARASTDPYSQMRAGEILRTDRAVLDQVVREASVRDGRQYLP